MAAFPLSILALAAGILLLMKVKKDGLGTVYSILGWLVVGLSIGFIVGLGIWHFGCRGGCGHGCGSKSGYCTVNDGHGGCNRTGTYDMGGNHTKGDSTSCYGAAGNDSTQSGCCMDKHSCKGDCGGKCAGECKGACGSESKSCCKK